MILTQVLPDTVPGVEHHTFICSECHVTENRVVFTRHGREDDTGPLPMHAGPLRPVSTLQDEQVAAAPTLLSRVLARIRGH